MKKNKLELTAPKDLKIPKQYMTFNPEEEKEVVKMLKDRFKVLAKYTLITTDDVEWSIDEQIRYHEEALKELKKQKLKNKWKFTEDEKVILRNLPGDYKYITRSIADSIYLFTDYPTKDIDEGSWKCEDGVCYHLSLYESLFTCIEWEDDKPCEFRKYLGE